MTNQTYIGEELVLFAHAQNWKKYFGSVLRPYMGRTVLEVGAGQGATTAVLCSGEEAIWVCLEPDPNLKLQIDDLIAARRLPPCCLSRLGLIQDLDSRQRYQTILYIDVLEHIEDDLDELQHAQGLLDRGGHLIVLAPAHQSLFSPFDQAIGHFRRYDVKTIQALTPEGCTLKNIMTLDSAGLLTSMANRAFLRQSLPTVGQILFWDRFLVPISRILDRLLAYSLGRSILGIWIKD